MTTQPTITEERLLTDAPISTTIAETVAEDAGVEPTALPPLYERVDPDALDTLFAPAAGGLSQPRELQFTYYGYVVTVVVDGKSTITLDEQSAE